MIPMPLFLATAALLIITLLWARDQMNARHALEDIISHSAQVCFLCQSTELGHNQLQDHDYMPAVLVYIPDPLLR